MQIMRTRWSPFSRHPVPFIMRLHTLDAFPFWSVGTIVRIVCLVGLLLYWWFGVVVMQADVQCMLEQLGPYLNACMVYIAWASHCTNIPIIAEATSLLLVRDVLPAVAIVRFGRKDQKFKVTAKGMRRDREVVQWSLLGLFLGFATLTVGGIAWRIWLGPEGTRRRRWRCSTCSGAASTWWRSPSPASSASSHRASARRNATAAMRLPPPSCPMAPSRCGCATLR
jgi:cellulose synthase (UDP-forming)